MDERAIQSRKQPGEATTKGAERRRSPRTEVLPALCAVLDHLPQAVVLVSSESKLLFNNHSAQLLFAQPGAISLRRGVVWVGESRAAALMAAAIAHSGQIGTPSGVALRIVHGRHAEEHRLYITGLGLRRRADPIALMVFAPHRGREVSPRLLQQLYRLTHAEATTAAQLFAGRRPTEVAKNLSISTNTVRSHIKRIFSKCQVTSQVELVRLMALGPGVA